LKFPGEILPTTVSAITGADYSCAPPPPRRRRRPNVGVAPAPFS